MLPTITVDVLEAGLYCKLKAYLKLTAQPSVHSDYENLSIRRRQESRQKAMAAIRSRYKDGAISIGDRVSHAILKNANDLFIEPLLEDCVYSVTFDGLKRIDGASTLGDFHYAPVLFSVVKDIRKDQRRLLGALSVILSRLQGRTPDIGIICCGDDCKVTATRLSADLTLSHAFIEDLAAMRESARAPDLILNAHCQICEFAQRCRSQAVEEDNISLLRGVGEKKIKRLARKGLFTLTQLAHTFRPRRKGKRSSRVSRQRDYALQALAIRDKTVYVSGTPNIPSGDVRIYLDIEGGEEARQVYLIGMLVCAGSSVERFSFWADNNDQEIDIFTQFMSTVSRYDNARIFCYGNYEAAAIKRLRKRVRKKRRVDQALSIVTNTLAIIYDHFYFPSYSNGLKEIAGFLGFSWTDENASGLQSIVWRSRWEETRDDHWRNKLIKYNQDDCDALKRVTEFLSVACAHNPVPGARQLGEQRNLTISSVEALDKLSDVRMRGNIKFFHPDFEFVNRCAYFDYQQERVFARAIGSRRKRAARRRTQRNRTIGPSKQILLTASCCPKCRGTNLETITGKRIAGAYSRVKRSFDLVVSNRGVKRRTIECRALGYRCAGCGHLFVPERYRRLAKHSHALMSWAIHHKVAYRLGPSAIREMFCEFFDLLIGVQEMHEFKSLMAQYYRPTYRRLLSKIVAGPVAHVDETSVKLRSGIGYVWVFASLDEVAYMYKPTREGEFLHGVLEGFHGVLVSDFFAAYDSIDCAQQKCLIHLIRDMNQSILDNPFDRELKLITQPFGEMLRAIVSTIDRYGLKNRFLRRHGPEVDKFFLHLSRQTLRSEVAVALRDRLTKYKDRLFTFISHDSVPWNNNCAENAIKQFAYYRDSTVGVMKEQGLSDYLVLLSIYQTCRCKGISFLKFLLSKERDLEAFSTWRRKQRRVGVELYPKGYTPPHLTFLQGKVERPFGG